MTNSPTRLITPTNLRILAIAALALLTLWIRLRLVGYTETGTDQSNTIAQALQWLYGGPFPLISIKSSFGVYNPAMVTYLFAIPLAISPNLFSVIWLIALVNLIGLAAAAWATMRVFGFRVGWWAALLFAVSPWAVYYGRHIWMQSFVPGFASLVYACALLYLADEQRPVYLILGCLFLAIAIQLHLTTIALAVSLVIVLACFRRRIQWKPLLIGIGVFILTFAPFIWFEISTGFIDIEEIRVAFGQGSSVADASSLLTMFDLLHSKGFYETFYSAKDQFRGMDLTWLYADTWITAVLSLAVIGGVAMIVRGLRVSRTLENLPPRRVGIFMTLVWLIVPVLMFISHSTALQNYYFLYLFPVPFVLMALLSDGVVQALSERLTGWWATRLGQIVITVLAFLPLAVIGFQQARLDVIGQNLKAANVSGARRVIDIQRSIDTSRRLMANHPDCQLVVISEGPTMDKSYWGLLREFVRDNPVRFAEAGAASLVPAPCGIYLVPVDSQPVQNFMDAFTTPLPDETISTPMETWTFHQMSPDQRSAALEQWNVSGARGEWANGLIFHGGTVAGSLQPGGRARLRLVWGVGPGPVDRSPVHFGNYILDANGQVVAQIDGVGLDSTEWQPGDVFQTFFIAELPADLPPGDYTVATAVYTFPQIVRVLLLDGSDMLVWGEFTVPAP